MVRNGGELSKKKKFTVVSLFSGAGGMDLGFELEGFKTIWANDNDRDSCETHRAWSKTTVACAPIEKINATFIPEADVILGGFPCQGFSLAGPRKVDDQRNTLYRYFVSLIDKKHPKAFVAENVKGILTLGNGEIIKAIVNEFADKGYNVKFRLLNAADYSVPQDRFRVIMVGIRQDLDTEFQYPRQHNKRVTLKDAIGHLPKQKLQDVCDASFSSRYMSRNRIRNWDEVSFTIPAMAKQVALHPSSPPMKKIHQDLWEFTNKDKTRRLSWQEAALIQTFPEGMRFAGNLTSVYKQIGNAVPVNLARAVAKQLHKALMEAEKEDVWLSPKRNTAKPMSTLASSH